MGCSSDHKLDELYKEAKEFCDNSTIFMQYFELSSRSMKEIDQKIAKNEKDYKMYSEQKINIK